MRSREPTGCPSSGGSVTIAFKVKGLAAMGSALRDAGGGGAPGGTASVLVGARDELEGRDGYGDAALELYRHALLDEHALAVGLPGVVRQVAGLEVHRTERVLVDVTHVHHDADGLREEIRRQVDVDVLVPGRDDDVVRVALRLRAGVREHRRDYRRRGEG